ncbi:MAG: oxaloacetate decarboxylase subunit alpha [Gammaproteobacteria bacterium]|nr:oxaloacetate decarboxylase subunit alpha [Gammaproteobacteria bacterium]NBT44718.1 oxaloacetate decarboxylase subunit alpha [Gammaproteobacteria bacterium]NBY23835.1 oxaloacetate decarboxylase subunit alpha [Gammaproteobacteria bacterium]NDE33896.1 oxaloacetate decarboxylase subunit alpha [Gammaproteobacteria bacterium]NDE55895.1 oxaloacetate decarboxylase subunit alpha [Gammaproteobacteria bacterium]
MAKLGITDVVLRDAHQSLLATRLRIDDMLPICDKLDAVGFWSLESWGGATFDACIRYLGEDPWDRLRVLKQALPKTPLQMLLRAQNLLGYRHYADDVVDKFVERSAVNGVDVFRIFDALNDPRNFERAIKATIANGKHAQGTISYTVSPVHTIEMWVDLAKRLEDMGSHSIAIKDMAGLLKPYEAFELVSRLKKAVAVPIHMQCHATTGLSTATIIKAAEAGIDNVDTAISSMSMTYGHSATEAVVAALEGQKRQTGLNLKKLEEIAAYFREVRKKYTAFEGSLRGIDSRILVAQVPGGMLTNMESQLKEQGALDRFDEVLNEIPKVRKDLGYIPLVTPTSQIVGSQAVINVMMGERYKSITKETQGVLRGEYGATPAAVNQRLQKKVLGGDAPISCRPADLLEPELEKLASELHVLASAEGVVLAKDEIDDVLTYALFPQIGFKFLQNRGNPLAFEPAPHADRPAKGGASKGASEAVFDVVVNGQSYRVEAPTPGVLAVNGRNYKVDVAPADAEAPVPKPQAKGEGEVVKAPMAGHVLRINVAPGQHVEPNTVVIVMEAMKMETEIRTRAGGIVASIAVKVGETVGSQDDLLVLE